MPLQVSKAPHSATPRADSLSATMEDYVEAIYCLAADGGTCRASQLAESIGVKRPTVTKALKRLHHLALISHAPYEAVTLTQKGRALAQRQVRTHRVLVRFLTEILQLPEQLAEHDACLIEHAISPETVERLVEFVDLIGNREWVRKKFNRKIKVRKRNRTWKSAV